MWYENDERLTKHVLRSHMHVLICRLYDEILGTLQGMFSSEKEVSQLFFDLVVKRWGVVGAFASLL